MNPVITIALQTHNFQRRLCWMLSSLAQQSRPDLISVDIAHMPGNGSPTTEAVCDLFGSRLKIRPRAWAEMEQFQYRGIVRNDQIAACRTEWLMFGDSDMVYHPDYFERLLHELGRNHAKAMHMISSGRMSNPKDQTNELVNRFVGANAVEVRDAWKLADTLEKREMRNCGAGFSQIINFIHAPHGGFYVDPRRNNDWGWHRGSNPKSDMQFRRRINTLGGPRKSLPGWFTANAIHLNHNRDPEAGKHLEEQR